MNKNEFIIGDQYSYKGDAPLTYVGEASEQGFGLFENNHGSNWRYVYENMTPCTKPEPKYPNPPLTHCEERIAFSRGANIECQYPNHKTWYNDDNPSWKTKFKYRVKVEKTKDDLRIKELYERVQILISELNDLNEEIAELEKIND
jgi:hypothetical protein